MVYKTFQRVCVAPDAWQASSQGLAGASARRISGC